MEAVSLIFPPIVGSIILLFKDDQEKWVMLNKVTQVRELTCLISESFLTALEDLCDHPDTPGMQHVLTEYEKLELSKPAGQGPSRERWVALMVEILPQDHPLKKELWGLYLKALEIQKEGSNSDLTSSTLSNRAADERFCGEQATVLAVIGGPLPQTISQASLLAAEYQEKWGKVEMALGRSFEKFELKEGTIFKNGTVIPKT
jgi:hypothetical protein